MARIHACAPACGSTSSRNIETCCLEVESLQLQQACYHRDGQVCASLLMMETRWSRGTVCYPRGCGMRATLLRCAVSSVGVCACTVPVRTCVCVRARFSQVRVDSRLSVHCRCVHADRHACMHVYVSADCHTDSRHRDALSQIPADTLHTRKGRQRCSRAKLSAVSADSHHCDALSAACRAPE